MIDEFRGKKILVTGGTGSIGSALVRHILSYDPKQLRILSRDETKHHDFRQELKNDERVRFLVGDVRDLERIKMAMEQVDIVFHASAMKHVHSCENDPLEAIKTNVLGTQNVIKAALDNNVEKVIGISTDKATDPVSVMGSTKLLAERLMVATNNFKGDKRTKFCFVRFGNVLCTRGSVVPLFYNQIKKGGPVTVTDKEMVRFFMSIDDAVNLVLKSSIILQDREIFVLKMPAIRIEQLAQAMVEMYAPRFGYLPENIEIRITGKKKGERIHEKLLSSVEASHSLETDDMFIITPAIGEDDFEDTRAQSMQAKKCESDEYSTEGKSLLSVEEIKQMIVKDKKNLMRVLGMNGFK